MIRSSGMLGPLVIAALVGVSPAAEPAGFDEQVQPFLKTYCIRCHNEQKQEGKFRLDTLPRDFIDRDQAQRWGEVVFRMNAGEMPPKEEPQPKADELGKTVDW